MIHLTNDAVQKHSENYGKHESGNKLSFADFHKYVKNTDPELDFFQHSYPKMVVCFVLFSNSLQMRSARLTQSSMRNIGSFLSRSLDLTS